MTDANDAPIAIDDYGQGTIVGLKSSYYAYDQNGGDNLDHLSDVQTIIDNNEPDATFIATTINYQLGHDNLGGGSDLANLKTFLGIDKGSLLVTDSTGSSDAILSMTGLIDLGAGSYRLKVNADDGYVIKIDGVIVAVVDKIQSPNSSIHSSFNVADSGLHKIEIIYWDQGGDYVFEPTISKGTGTFELLSTYSLTSGFNTSEDVAITFDPAHLFTNDSDPEGDALSLAPLNQAANIYPVSNAVNGRVVVDGDGNIVFTPDNNYFGAAQFDYTITDGNGGYDTATVYLTVTPVNDAPIVDSNVLAVLEESTDTPLNLKAPTDIDTDSSDLIITVTGLPNLGTVTLADGTLVANGDTLDLAQLQGLVYDAPSDYESTSNAGSFTYSVADGANVVTGSTSFSVTPINDAPTSAGLHVDTNEDVPYYFSSKDFDFSDVDAGDTLSTVKITQLASDGQLEKFVSGTWQVVSVSDEFTQAELNPDAQGHTMLRFVADSDEASTTKGGTYASFSYQVSDGVVYSADTVGNIEVVAVADAPSISVALDVVVAPSGLTLTSWEGQNIGGHNGDGASAERLTSSIDALIESGTGTSSDITLISSEDGDDSVYDVLADEANYITGLVYLEAGETYTVSMTGDDSYLIEIGESFVLSGTWGGTNSGSVIKTFTPTEDGYYTLDYYQHNQKGAGSYNVSITDENDDTPKFYTSEAALLDGGLVLTEHLDTDGNGYYQEQIFNEGDLDTDIRLSQVTKSLNDNDDSEELTLTVTGVPAGMLITDGTSPNSVESTGQDIDITGWDSSTLTLNSNGANISDNTFKLTFTATATELSNNDQAQSSVELDVTLLTGASGDTDTVNESDIDASDPVIVSGNIFDNDSLDDNSALVSINGQGVNSSGDITIVTSEGNILTVDSQGNYSYSLIYPVTHNDGSNDSEIIESFNYVVNSAGQQVESQLNITIIDDAPTGSDITHNTMIDASALTSNLTFIVDGSGSMNDDDMAAVEEAIYALTVQYKAFSDITFNVVLFESNGTQTTTWISGDNITKNASGEIMITYPDGASTTTERLQDFLEHASSTNISVGLDEVRNSYANAPAAGQDVAYFFGDGDDNVNQTAFNNAITNWTSFLAGSNGEVPIDALFSYSINTGSVMEDIAAVADSATGSVHRDAENVVDVIDLKDAVLQDIVFIEQGDLFANSITQDIDFGADGGHIHSVQIGNITVNYDSANPIQNIEGETGIYTIDFDTGTYTYSLNAINSDFAPHSDVIEMVIVDNDGDSTNSKFTHNVDFTGITQVVTAVDADNTSSSAGLIFDITLNTVASTDQTYDIDFTHSTNETLDTSLLMFSANVILNADGTITVPAGVSSFIVSSSEIHAAGDTTLVIGRDGNSANDHVTLQITDLSYDVNLTDADDLIVLSDDITSNNSNVPVEINTGAGDDTILAGDDIYYANINTGDGNDSISIGVDSINPTSDASGYLLYNGGSIEMGDGNDTLSIKGIGNTDYEVNLGAGNDTLSISGSTINLAETIELGEGQDTLELSALSSSLFNGVNNSASTVTVDASGVPTITFSRGNNINFTVSGAETIYFGGDDSTYQFNTATGKYEPAPGNSSATIIDGIIEGLEYQTSSGITGLTNADGSFSFNTGDVVTFSIGNVVIGDIDMSQITDGQVFLQDIADIDRSDMSDQYVENMAVLLQSIDNNGDAYDGIVITDEIRVAFSDADFDLAAITEEELTAIIYAETGLESVDEEQAMEHVGDMLEEYANITVDQPTADFDSSEIFNWLSEDNTNSIIPSDLVNNVEPAHEETLILSDLLVIGNDDSLEQYFGDNLDISADLDLDTQNILAAASDGIELTDDETGHEIIVNGLLNHGEDSLIVASAVDDSQMRHDDDLSNGFDH